MKFIRVHGRVVPIRDKGEEDGLSKKKAAVGGAAVGTGYHVAQGTKLARAEKLAKNHRSLAKFKANLQPGDILVMGSAPKHAGGHTLGEFTSLLPKALQKPAGKIARKAGLVKNSIVLSNTDLLTGVGAGSKYHAAMYVGNGKVVHMSTDAGAVTESLKHASWKQNVTAMRFPNAGQGEVKSAIKFAKASVKNKVQYQKSMGLTSAASNVILPVGKKASQNFSEMVCHTLPIRAYSKRAFSMGEHTFAGDFLKTPGLTAVARHDVVKAPLAITKNLVGSAAKGLKWGVAGAVGAAAINYAIKKHRESKQNAIR